MIATQSLDVRLRLRLFCMVCLLSLASFARADFTTDFTRVESQFIKALAGVENPDLVVGAFASLTADESVAPVLLAYKGAAQTLQGRNAWMPWNKFKATERGLSSIDKALRQLSPQHDAATLRGIPVPVKTRLIAASTFIALSDLIFHRTAQGRDLLLNAVASFDFATLPPALRARHHQQLGIATAKTGQPAEAAASFQQCLAADPNGSVAEDCRKRLAEIGA